MSGYTYFIRAADDGPIKIGHTSSHPRTRMAALQTGSPVPLELIGFLEGAHHEAAFHTAFGDSRLHGEWFAPTPELLTAISRAMQHQRAGGAALDIRRGELWRTVAEWEDRLKNSPVGSWRLWTDAKQAIYLASIEHGCEDEYATVISHLSRFI